MVIIGSFQLLLSVWNMPLCLPVGSRTTSSWSTEPTDMVLTGRILMTPVILWTSSSLQQENVFTFLEKYQVYRGVYVQDGLS